MNPADTPHPPTNLSFDQAPDWIAARVAEHPFALIGVTGPVGAGKSTLARRVAAAWGARPLRAADHWPGEPGGAVILSTDQYLPDYAELPEHERDLPERSDLARLEADLAALARGVRRAVPVWSFHSHRRESEVEIGPAGLVIVEGIHALHATVRRLLHLCVFVDSPRSVRWSRWEHIESTGQRGWGVEKARTYFDAVAEPSFGAREAEYRNAAHVFVSNH